MMLQSIIQSHFDATGRTTFWDDRTWQALRAVARCRTPSCGMHVDACQNCGERQLVCNSCRDRHCPLCQGRERAAWTAARESDVLPVPYFHVVCTLSHDLLDLVRWAPATMYALLHRGVAESLKRLLSDNSVLGARCGFIAVLHTWSSSLMLHPHIHIIIPAGGLDPTTGAWKPCRYNASKKRPFLVSVHRLRRCFMKTMARLLRQAYDTDRFHAEGNTRGYCPPPHLDHGHDFRHYLNRAMKKRWVVYVKRPFAHPRALIRYLGRYTHRTAIAPSRIQQYDRAAQVVRFAVRDRHSGRMIPQDIPAQEFVRRFAQHILPKGFHRIRHVGFLANACRRACIEQIRRQLNISAIATSTASPAQAHSVQVAAEPAPSSRVCPCCGGAMRAVLLITPDGRTLSMDRRTQSYCMGSGDRSSRSTRLREPPCD